MYRTDLKRSNATNKEHSRLIMQKGANIKKILRTIHENDNLLQYGSLKVTSKNNFISNRLLQTG
jgi:hypothetical protein